MEKIDEEIFVIEKKHVKILFVGIFVVWGIFGLITALFFKGDFNAAGVFGDMFGSLNALFSGLAFSGVILTILLQRNELIQTRKEQEGMKLALKKQVEMNAKAVLLEGYIHHKEGYLRLSTLGHGQMEELKNFNQKINKIISELESEFTESK